MTHYTIKSVYLWYNEFVNQNMLWRSHALKTLILNGSTKIDGDTAALINELKKHLRGEVITLSQHDGISPCTDCRYCWENPGCCIEDKLREVYPFMEDCDNIVLASPIWFSTLSGPLLNLAGRLTQPYFTAAYFRKEEVKLKRKKGVLLLAGGEKGTEVKAAATAHIIFKLLNALPCVANVFSLATDKLPAREDENALKQARDAAILLNTPSAGTPQVNAD
jgi:multimeric flavodoxin WrbA